MMFKIKNTALMMLSLASLLSYPLSASLKQDIEAVSTERAHELDRAFEKLIKKHHINTAGIAVIKNGKVNWHNNYGMQSEDKHASADTLYNIASITKTITAETILRLVDAGKLSLDESMASFWVDPDVKDDPKHKQLTPRMSLTHTSGFMNWRFFSDDFKLKFVNEPGTTYGYSGEGIQYMVKYAENKLGMPFDKLVDLYVFQPSNIKNASIQVDKNNFPRIAKPLDEDGQFYGYYCHPQGYCRKEGDVSATGDMVITVNDYSKFLIDSMQGKGLSNAIKKDRNTLQTKAYNIDCTPHLELLCPTQVGYGLGWNITQLENDQLVGHSGTDWSMVSLTYYYQGSGDGLIVFFNAPNKAGIAGMVDALKLLDQDSPKLHEYIKRRDREN